MPRCLRSSPPEAIDGLCLKLSAGARSLCSVMARTVFRLLLTLTLVFNGLSPVWAMNPMNHGQHHTHHGAANSADAGVPVPRHDHASMHDHAAMSGHAMARQTEPSDPKGPHRRSCCDGPASCQCGCMLPPAMLQTLAVPAPQTVAVAPPRPFLDAVTATRNAPPFRPPAV